MQLYLSQQQPSVTRTPTDSEQTAVNAAVVTAVSVGGVAYGYASKAAVVAAMNAQAVVPSPAGLGVVASVPISQAAALLGEALSAVAISATVTPTATAGSLSGQTLTWAQLAVVLQGEQQSLTNQQATGVASVPVNATMLALLQSGVTAGLISQAQVNALTQIPAPTTSAVSVTEALLIGTGSIAAGQTALLQVADVSTWPASVTQS
jgi:hypothetical protein